MTISTHILDTSLGRPARAVPLTLTTPAAVHHATTDLDGRHRFTLDPPPGVHTLRFNTGAYYASQGIDGLYPHVEITFTVSPGQTHYHIPLLLTANGYTTYRGS